MRSCPPDSVLRRPFEPVDHQRLSDRVCWLELQTELFVNGSEDRRRNIAGRRLGLRSAAAASLF